MLCGQTILMLEDKEMLAQIQWEVNRHHAGDTPVVEGEITIEGALCAPGQRVSPA